MEFGKWVDSVDDQQDPYIQLLPLTTVAQAHKDFVETRLSGTDTTGDPQFTLLPPDQLQHSPVSDEEKKKKYQEMVLSRWPYILTGCLVGVILIIGFVVWKCCCKRKGKNTKRNNKAESAMFGGSAPGALGGGPPKSYSQLHDSASSNFLPLKEPTPAHRSNSTSTPYGHQDMHSGGPYQHRHDNGSFVSSSSAFVGQDAMQQQQSYHHGSYPPSPSRSGYHDGYLGGGGGAAGYGAGGYGKAGQVASESPNRYGSPGPPPYSSHPL